MQETTCCFFGHRQIVETVALREQLYTIIEELVIHKKVDTFLFGSKSQFNSLCHELVTKVREKHPHIKRVYVRAEFPQIRNDYRAYLLKSYEDTYYPEKLLGAGKAVYVQRNYTMINESCFCIVYYKKDYLPVNRNSGTKLALNYAIRKDREIVILPK